MTDPLHGAYIGLAAAALCTLAALATVSLLAPRFGVHLLPGRSASIDGLRGYAAFFVFIGHAAAWYYFVRSDRWAIVPLRALGNLGSVSVVIFFMITAFLFSTKLLDSRGRRIDWMQLLVSRIMRLTPLYLFAMLALLLVLGAVGGYDLVEDPATLLSSIVKWLTFTIAGAPDMNGVRDTWLIIAGVTWSLPFEIFFYLLLPLIALLIGVDAPNRSVILFSAAAALAVLYSRPDPTLALGFVGGILAAWLVRIPRLHALAGSWVASAGALLAFVGIVVSFSPFKLVPLGVLSIAFSVVAAGNSVFGTLTNRAARLLGEVSYSMYLLHAIVLYVLVHWVIGVHDLALMPATRYWMMILGLTPVLVALCLATFVLIERPGIASVVRITAALRSILAGLKRPSG